MKEHFEKKVEELGLNLEEANKDFKSYLEKFPEYKVTKANITKFLKSMSSEVENLEPDNTEMGNFYIGKDVNGKKLYR